MNDVLIGIIVSGTINAAITYGVISTKIAWLRRDIDKAMDDIDSLHYHIRTGDNI